MRALVRERRGQYLRDKCAHQQLRPIGLQEGHHDSEPIDVEALLISGDMLKIVPTVRGFHARNGDSVNLSGFEVALRRSGSYIEAPCLRNRSKLSQSNFR